MVSLSDCYLSFGIFLDVVGGGRDGKSVRRGGFIRRMRKGSAHNALIYKFIDFVGGSRFRRLCMWMISIPGFIRKSD